MLYQSNDILRLCFDEGGGAVARDASGRLPEAEIQYRFLHARYTADKAPERRRGVEGGALFFDGSSTAVVYPADAVTLSGKRLTLSAWIAPRTFDWDLPGAAARGEARLTAIVGQMDAEGRRGALLGYHQFGRLCFRAGDGERCFQLWADTARLRRRRWNHVAAVFDGDAGRMTLYQDGEPVGSMEIPAGSGIAPAIGERLMIGRSAHAQTVPSGTFHMFAGLMSEVRAEAAALDAETVRARASLPVPEIADGEIDLPDILTDDFQKTQYHGGPHMHWMNEPHAPIYYNGMYHLFFQGNSLGPFWRNICWGHLVSRDTVRWRPVRDAIVPEEGGVTPDGVWSGGAAMDVNGVPVLFFAAADFDFARRGLISNQNIGAAYPADLSDPELKDWIVSEELAVRQKEGEGRPGEFRDAHVWREDGVWRMVVCGGSTVTNGGAALLYETDRLEVLPDGKIDMDWRYRGPLYEMTRPEERFGTSWELPVLLPLRSRSGERRRHALFILPAPAGVADVEIYYYVGDFDGKAGRFVPDPVYRDRPRRLDYGDGVFTGPSAMRDPVTGRTLMFSIMQDQRDGATEAEAGWAHCAGLTRCVRLSDDGTDVCVEPDPRLYDLLGDTLLRIENASMEETNAAMANLSGDLLYLSASLRPQGCRRFGLTVKAGANGDATAFTCDAQAGTIRGETNSRAARAGGGIVDGALPLPDGRLEMEVFIDRSLVEAFFNRDKAVTMRAYAAKDSQGMRFFADGGLLVERLEIRRVNSIHE